MRVVQSWAAALAVAAVALPSVPAHADPNVLWRIVHDACVPHVEAGLGPKPCERVDLEGGVAHWHGAIPGEALQQVSVTFAPGIKWMERVSDQQYAGKAGR